MILAISIVGIVLIVLAGLIVLLFVGGWVANTRRRHADAARLRAQVEAANAELAAAHAQDKGWERSAIEEAARATFSERHPGIEIQALHLVQVVDRPGIESDLAVFRALGGGREETITLGRDGDAWVAGDRI